MSRLGSLLKTALWGAVTLTVFTTNLRAGDELNDVDEANLSRFSELIGQSLHKRALAEGSATFLNDPDVIVTPGTDDGYGGDPSDKPTDVPQTESGTVDLPFITRKSGAAELLALEALYQTLMFYGVVHIVEREGSKKSFRVVETRSGNFKNLTSLDVAFAIRTFSLYITALLCNDPSMSNFSRLLQQVKPEELGLRFKYDMAWALLGNHLPREPNDIFALGSRWRGVHQIFASTKSLSTMPQGQSSELRSWLTSLGDVVNILTRLNKLMCFVDARPDPREEIKKRSVINALLRIDRGLNDRYADLKEIIDEIDKETKAAKIEELKRNP